MSPTTQSAIIDDMLDPLTEALTHESARHLANLKAKPSVQARVDALATKCNEGELSESEREEYETYIRVGNLFTVLKAKARAVLAQSTNG